MEVVGFGFEPGQSAGGTWDTHAFFGEIKSWRTPYTRRCDHIQAEPTGKKIQKNKEKHASGTPPTQRKKKDVDGMGTGDACH